jgi:hypothetical protein
MSIIKAIRKSVKMIAAECFNSTGVITETKFTCGRFVMSNGQTIYGIAHRAIVVSPSGEVRPIAAMRHDRNHCVTWTSQIVEEGDFIFAMKVGSNLSTSFFGKFVGGEIYPTNDKAANQLATQLEPVICDWLQAGTDQPTFLPYVEGFQKLHNSYLNRSEPMTRGERLMTDLKKIDKDYRDHAALSVIRAGRKVLDRLQEEVNSSLQSRKGWNDI